MKLTELYSVLEEKFPKALSCEWDNDGLMCASSLDNEVKKVLCVLDVTDAALKYAAENGFDTIISHHPMIFHHIGAVTPENHISARAVLAIKNDINVFSYHTRADAVCGGVNDILAKALGLVNIAPFGDSDGDIGRVGELPEETDIHELAKKVKETLGSQVVNYSVANDEVKKVALLGGAGKSFVSIAKDIGADVFVSGEIGYSLLTEAPEMGISLIEAGHFFTEEKICGYFGEILDSLGIENEFYNSNVIKSI